MTATRKQTAEFILREAQAAGLRVGTDGEEIVLALPRVRDLPHESYFSFQRAILAHREEIIALIMAEAQSRGEP